MANNPFTGAPKIGRNDPCHCGSGRKFKKCHGRPEYALPNLIQQSRTEEEIREGDRLVLFTDGVSEARDTAGNDFSEERLEQIIAANRTSPARELIATILDSVSSFSGGRTDDDLTLVAVAIR